MCQNFEIAPVFDMFASWHHHQLPRYFSTNVKDKQAERHNAFNYHWDSDVVLYINSPWSLLDQVIDKIIADKSTVLLVTPRWFDASWYKKLTKPYISTRSATVFTFILGETPTRLRSDPTPEFTTHLAVRTSPSPPT